MAYPTTVEHHKVYPYTSIMASPYSGDSTGVVDCAAAIESIKANQSNTGTIYIPKGTFKIGTNLSIPVGMTLEFAASAYFTIDAGITLTILGPIVAPDGQDCFTGTGVLSFGTTFPVTDTTKILQPGTWVVAANTAIPSNVELRLRKGAIISVATGVTLTINGTIDAGLHQIFTLVGTGTVVFAAGSTVYSSWFETLSIAKTCIGAVATRLVITKAETLIGNTTIPANIDLVIPPGNILTTIPGTTLGIYGTLEAGPYQIFAGTGTILLGSLIYIKYDEWSGTTGSNVVFTAGDQTVAGVKTFSSFPVTPSSAPTTDYQVANKKYVDDSIPTHTPFALLQNRQAQNTDGGTATLGSWLIIPLNTEQEDADSIVDSSALPAFTLVAGIYRFEGSFPFILTQATQTRLYNVTDGTVDLIGSCAFASLTATAGDTSFIEGTVTITGTKQFRIEYQCAATEATDGLGYACNFGVEVFAQLKITKIV